MNIRKILVGAAAGALMYGAMVTSAFAATPTWDLTGTWTFNDIWLGTPYVHTMVINSFNPVTGVFSGTGYYNADPSLTWDVNGVEDGSNITLFHLLVTAVAPGVTIDGTGTVNATGTGISGTGYQSNLPGSNPNIEWSATGTAKAVCTKTGFMRDGIDLTASLINPTTTVSGEVNATGCNIGVYYDQSGIVKNADIHGSNYFGVLVNADDNIVVVDVKDSQIHQIGETPFNGAQHGVAVYYRAMGTGSVTGTVSGNAISQYQKGGITVNGSGATVSVTGNTVTGLGRVNFIAQNGIQFGWGANGVARDNVISDNFYTGTVGVGPNPGGQNPPGWEYTSAGLLLYQPGDLKHSMNKYSGNQKNVSMVP